MQDFCTVTTEEKYFITNIFLIFLLLAIMHVVYIFIARYNACSLKKNLQIQKSEINLKEKKIPALKNVQCFNVDFFD